MATRGGAASGHCRVLSELHAIPAARSSSISGVDAAQTVRLTAAIALAADSGRRVRPAELS